MKAKPTIFASVANLSKNLQNCVFLFYLMLIRFVASFQIKFGDEFITTQVPVLTAQDVALSLCARGIRVGKIHFEENALPFATEMTNTYNGNVYYKLNDICQEQTTTKPNRGWMEHSRIKKKH
eukprot:NODE_523_length_6504_cov_0.524434.p5 type:complete len:123 gc:universal NODE_523_length_6504_cov_0.524434:5534-5166(-)